MLGTNKLFAFRKNTSKRIRSLAGENQRERPSPNYPRTRNNFGEMFYTPSGGIPARSGTSPGPWTAGKAECAHCEYYEDGANTKIRTSAFDWMVYNMTPNAIEGGTLVQAKVINGRWTIDMDPCESAPTSGSNSGLYVGTTAPANTALIWIDTSGL